MSIISSVLTNIVDDESVRFSSTPKKKFLLTIKEMVSQI